MTPQNFADPDVIARNLRRIGWGYGEYQTDLGYTVELRRDGRVILATAPTMPQAWQLAERAAVGDRRRRVRRLAGSNLP